MASIVREDVPVHMVRPSLEAIPADELPPGFAVRRWREPADGRAWEQIWHDSNAAHYERCRSLPWLEPGRSPPLLPRLLGRDLGILPLPIN